MIFGSKLNWLQYVYLFWVMTTVLAKIRKYVVFLFQVTIMASTVVRVVKDFSRGRFKIKRHLCVIGKESVRLILPTGKNVQHVDSKDVLLQE